MRRESIISFAQDSEDLILYGALREISNGFYIDVGASDPVRISVTKLFYDRGWSGINIEPNISDYNALCDMRPRDVNLNIGASNKSGEMILFGEGTGATLLSSGTSDKQIQTKIEVKTLDQVIKGNCLPSQVIHFCKVDVEGFEKEVLDGFNFEYIRPWIFIIESTIPNTITPCYEQWESILLRNGYRLALAYGINRYYVDERSKANDLCFYTLEELLTQYDVFRVEPISAGEKFHFTVLKDSSIRESLNWIGMLNKHILYKLGLRMKRRFGR